MYTINVLTGPTSEPVSASLLKTYLRTNTTAEDTLLNTFIESARRLFENETNLGIMYQTLVQYNDQNCPMFYLMRGPINSITSVKYYDQNNVLQTADPSTYNTDIVTGGMGRIWFPNGQPSTSSTVRPIWQTTFNVGFYSVPADITTAILLLAAYWFEQRTPYADRTLQSIPKGWDSIISKYKLGNYYQWNMDRGNLWNGYYGNGSWQSDYYYQGGLWL